MKIRVLSEADQRTTIQPEMKRVANVIKLRQSSQPEADQPLAGFFYTPLGEGYKDGVLNLNLT